MQNRIAAIDKLQRKIDLQKAGLILESHGIHLPDQTLLKAMRNNDDTINPLFTSEQQTKPLWTPNLVVDREESDRRSYLVDPMQFQSSFGFKHKPHNLSYDMLRAMAKTPVINAIIRTRVNQVASFSEPQEDKYQLGYIIRKKKSRFGGEDKLTKQDQKNIDFLYQFIENCGVNNSHTADDFDSFTRKLTRDSLILDQACFEIVYNRKGEPYEFYAVDGATMRIADSYDDDGYNQQNSTFNQRPVTNRTQVLGYYPSFVQVYQNNQTAEFYPWEMSFGVRNPSTDVRLNGYGVSELEEMVNLITSMVHGEEYNRRFFKQGSAPKGIFKVSGGLSEARLQEFRQYWQANMQGVANSWRTPVLEADKVEWVDLQKNNRDMEFSNWLEYLIKVGCAIFAIDPAEVNFPLSGGSNSSSLFEGNNEQRLKYSRDKGLFPLLKFFQKRLNKFLVSKFFDGQYEFKFVGVDATTPQEEQEMDIKALSNYETLNEVRVRRGLKPLDDGDYILNSMYFQNIQIQQQAAMFGGGSDAGQQQADEGVLPDETDLNTEENPFSKALQDFITKL